MLYNFHGLTVECSSPDADTAARWAAAFASRPPAVGPPDVRFTMRRVSRPPSPPSGEPDFRQGDLLQYYLRPNVVIAHFPRYGQLQLDLAAGLVEGHIVPEALTAHGVFEDLAAIGLSPFLRRRGMFLLHAFAAALPGSLGTTRPPAEQGREERQGWEVRAVLIVGDIGAGKTTTGLALLHAGWRLLSNDSPILRDGDPPEVLAYPGLLSAYPDSLLRFPELRSLAPSDNRAPPAGAQRKITFAAERYFPDVWIERAPAAAILFPRIEPRAGHALEPLPAPEALRLLLPHAIEQWDREMIAAHLALLRKLVEQTPAYRLRLGPEVERLPALLARIP